MSEKQNRKTLEIHRNEKGLRVLTGKEWLFVVIVGLAALMTFLLN